jgi:hypothetical protein
MAKSGTFWYKPKGGKPENPNNLKRSLRQTFEVQRNSKDIPCARGIGKETSKPLRCAI